MLRRIKDFFKKSRLFGRLSDRQKKLAHYNEGNNSEEARIAYAFGIMKVISSGLLVLLLFVTVLFGSSVISYDKVYYMVKDISFMKSYGESVPDVLSYSKPVQNQVFDNFKNGLLVASDSEIKLFTSTGRVTMTSGSEFINPRVSVSDEYALIYDQGRKTLSVYNSFVRLYSESTEYPIAHADMARNGVFLIVTKSVKYNSVVKIYDQNFDLLSEYSKNDHVIYASLSSNGRYVAVLSLRAQGGESIVALTVLDSKKNEIISEKTFRGSLPYMCEFVSEGRIAVFLNDKACICDTKGKILSENTYRANVEKIDVSSNGFAILYSENALNGRAALEVFNADGASLLIKPISESIRDMKLSNDNVYILTSREIVRINTRIGSESRQAATEDDAQIVLFSDGRVSLCSQTSSSYIKFD